MGDSRCLASSGVQLIHDYTQLISKCCLNLMPSYEIKVTKPQLSLGQIFKEPICSLLKWLYRLVLSIDFCD